MTANLTIESMRNMFYPITMKDDEQTSDYSRAHIGCFGKRVVTVFNYHRKVIQERLFSWEDLARKVLELSSQRTQDDQEHFASAIFRLNELYDVTQDRINQSWFDWFFVSFRERVLGFVWPQYQTQGLRQRLNDLREEVLRQ